MAVNVSFNVESFARSIRQSGYLSLRQAARALTRMYDAALSLELEATPRLIRRDIKPLLEAGLVANKRPPGHRQALVVLTPMGRRQLVAGIQLWDFAQSQLIEMLGDDRWKELQRQLDALAEADL